MDINPTLTKFTQNRHLDLEDDFDDEIQESRSQNSTASESNEVLKNVQVSKMFGVSEPSVLNWIRASTENKNELELIEYKGKMCIANTPHNLAEMQQLADKGRKYRNKVPIKKVNLSHFGTLREDHLFEMLYNLEHQKRISYKSAFIQQTPEQLERFFNTEMTLDSKYLQAKLLVQDSQQTWTGHLKRDHAVNLITTSYSCPYTYKSYFQDVCAKRPVESVKFIGLNDAQGEVFKDLNQSTFEKSNIKAPLKISTADVDDDPLWSIFNKDKSEVNVVMLLGEAFYNIEFFVRCVRNINRTLTSGDFIITNIYLNNPSSQTDFDGFSTDGTQELMFNIIKELDLENEEDFELENVFQDIDPSKKWYARTGSKKWNMVTQKEIHFHYSYDGVIKDFIWPKSSKIELANWKLWQEDFPIEAAKLGYSVVSLNTNMEQTEAMVLMQKL